MITLRPGANRSTALSHLQELRTSAGNLLTGSGSTAVDDYFVDYADWCINAVRILQEHVAPADLERLILEAPGGLHSGMLSIDHQNASVLRKLVDLEVDRRVRTLDLAIRDLQAADQRWAGPGRFVMADTSFYINHHSKLEEVEFGELVSERDVPIRLLLPTIVVDELDGLKQNGNKDVRWRALYSLAVVDRVLEEPAKPGWLHEDHDGFADTTIEMIFDPPHHTRLPINDDEIVDRCLAIQSMVGAPILLTTYDTGQSMRARAVGLEVLKLSVPLS